MTTSARKNLQATERFSDLTARKTLDAAYISCSAPLAVLTVLPLNCYNLNPSLMRWVSCLTGNHVAESTRKTNQDEKEKESEASSIDSNHSVDGTSGDRAWR